MLPKLSFFPEKKSTNFTGQRPRVVCARYLENKVHAVQRQAPIRPAGGLGRAGVGGGGGVGAL